MPECSVRPLSNRADLCDMEQKGLFSLNVLMLFYFRCFYHKDIITHKNRFVNTFLKKTQGNRMKKILKRVKI